MGTQLEILDSPKGKRIDGQRTICEEHRTIADLLVIHLADQPQVLAEIMPHVNAAFVMGIKLVQALIERKLALPDWERNNVAEAAALRKERARLLKELYAAGHRL